MQRNKQKMRSACDELTDMLEHGILAEDRNTNVALLNFFKAKTACELDMVMKASGRFTTREKYIEQLETQQKETFRPKS